MIHVQMTEVIFNLVMPFWSRRPLA